MPYGVGAPARRLEAGAIVGHAPRSRHRRQNDARTQSPCRPGRQAPSCNRWSRAARSAAAACRPASPPHCCRDGRPENRGSPTASSSLQPLKKIVALAAVESRLRSACAVAPSVPGARPSPRSMRPGNSPSSMLEASPPPSSGAWYGAASRRRSRPGCASRHRGDLARSARRALALATEARCVMLGQPVPDDSRGHRHGAPGRCRRAGRQRVWCLW